MGKERTLKDWMEKEAAWYAEAQRTMGDSLPRFVAALKKAKVGQEEEEKITVYEVWERGKPSKYFAEEKQMSEDERKFTSDEMSSEYDRGFEDAKLAFSDRTFYRLDPEDTVVKELLELLRTMKHRNDLLVQAGMQTLRSEDEDN